MEKVNQLFTTREIKLPFKASESIVRVPNFITLRNVNTFICVHWNPLLQAQCRRLINVESLSLHG